LEILAPDVSSFAEILTRPAKLEIGVSITVEDATELTVPRILRPVVSTNMCCTFVVDPKSETFTKVPPFVGPVLGVKLRCKSLKANSIESRVADASTPLFDTATVIIPAEVRGATQDTKDEETNLALTLESLKRQAR